jgi:hypothetical protein
MFSVKQQHWKGFVSDMCGQGETGPHFNHYLVKSKAQNIVMLLGFLGCEPVQYMLKQSY